LKVSRHWVWKDDLPRKKFASFSFSGCPAPAIADGYRLCGLNNFAQTRDFVTKRMREIPVASEAVVGASRKVFSLSFHNHYDYDLMVKGAKNDFDGTNPCRSLAQKFHRLGLGAAKGGI
jgi:hypothetical protein